MFPSSLVPSIFRRLWWMLLTLAFHLPASGQESRQFPLGPIGGYYSVSANSSLAVVRSVDAGEAGANAGLQAGDFIYGAFGQTFTPTGADHYGVTQELGFAVDRAEAGNGTLPLMVMRPGTGALTLNVALAAAGAIGPAYPINSAKYAPMYETAVADLHTRSMTNNGDMGYLTGFTGMCLLGHPNWNDTAGAKPYRLSIDKIRDDAIRKLTNWAYAPTEDKLVDNSPIPNPSDGSTTWTNWEIGQLVMFLSEYYVKTSDSSVLATLQRGAEMCANTVQWWKQPAQGSANFQPEYNRVAGMSSHGGVREDYIYMGWACGINMCGVHNIAGMAFARRAGVNMNARPKDGHYFGFNLNPGDTIPAGIINALPTSITLPQYAADPARGITIANSTSNPVNRSDASDPFWYNPSINQKYLMQMNFICRRSLNGDGSISYTPESGGPSDSGGRTPGGLLAMAMYRDDVGGLDAADLNRLEMMKNRITTAYMTQQSVHSYCIGGQVFQALATPYLNDRQQRYMLDNWRFFYALSRTANNGYRYLSGRNKDDAGGYLDNNHCASINIALPYGIANGRYSLIPGYNTNRILANFKSPALTWPSIEARYAKVTNASQQAFQVDICDGMGAVLSAGSYTANWTHVSGPATATFSDSSSANTTVTFPAPGRYRIQLAATSGANSITEPIDVDVSFIAPPAGYTQGFVNYQAFTGIGGSNISDLTSSSKYINNTPDVTGMLTQLDSTYSGDNYGQRIQGYIVPQVTGSYRFYLSSDDASQFVFNGSGAAPTTNVAINLTNGVSKFTWTAQSVDYTLTAGQPYYFQLLHKEAGGGDHAAVAWTGPNISSPTIIPGYALATDTASSITSQPLNQITTLGANVTFGVTVAGSGPFVYQWRLNGVPYWAPSSSPNLNLTNVGYGALGTYDCVITTPTGTLVSNSVTLSIAGTFARITGGLRREVWSGIGGTDIAGLTSQQGFPLFPSVTTMVSSAEAPKSYGDKYGQKLSGWINPPVSGNYKFFIASDDSSQLWLSTDDTAANKVKIADYSGATGFRNYSYGAQSTMINLVAGEKYYIEILHKEGTGGDHLSVAWQMPGEAVPANGSEPIPGIYLEFDQYQPLLTNHWKLDEASGATCADSVGTATATLYNNPSRVVGLMGNAASFSGANQYAEATLDVSETVYAMSLWFRTTQASGGLFSAVNGDTNYDRCVYLSGGNLKASVWENETISTSGTNYADGQWHHVLHTFGGAVGGQKLYVDGVLAASGSKSSSDNSQQVSVRIGDAIASTPRYFNGQIDDVRIYNAGLGVADADSIYAGGINAAPQMNAQTFVISEGASVGATVGTMIATDASSGQTLSYNIAGGNVGNRFAINSSTGAITLVATLDYEQSGTQVLTITATDNGTPVQSVTTTATVNVTNVNEPPVFTSSSINGAGATGGASYSGTLAGAATDVDAGDTLTYAKVNGPAWLNIAANGTLSGTPGGADGGNNSFTVMASDAGGLFAQATLNIKVTAFYGNGTWINATGGTWQAAANWSGDVIASGADRTADFSKLNITANTTVTLDGALTIGNLLFGDTTPSNNWTLNTGTGGPLTLDMTSGMPAITVNDQTTTISVVLEGTKGLNKAGAGTLVLTGNNTYTGGTTVSAGTLAVGTRTMAAGSGITIAAGAVLESRGQLVINANSTAGFAAISGAGALTLRSTTNSAASPDIYFNANDVTNSRDNWGSSISTAIDLGSSQRYIWGKTNHGSVSQFLTSPNGPDVNITGAISGSGGLSIIAQHAYTGSNPMEVPFVLSGNNSFTGMLEIQRGSVYLNHANALAQGNALVLNPATGNNARFFLYGKNASVSNLTSSGAGSASIANGNLASDARTTLGMGMLTVNQTSATTYAGTLVDHIAEYNYSGGGKTQGPLALIKTGPATLSLTGASTYTGPTSINGGTLLIDGSLANTATTVAGGTLGGAGTIGGAVTVQNGGTLAPGTGGIGTLTINNTLSLSGTTQMEISRSGATLAADKLSGVSTVTYGGSLVVTRLGPDPLAAGDSFQLFSAATYSGSFANVTLPALTGALVWDTTKLLDEGSIRVVLESGASVPVAVADSATVAEDGSVSIAVIANDTDGDDDVLEIQSVTQGAHGTVAIVGNNVTYTPEANWNGTDSFNYTVTDNQHGTATAAVTVTVNAVNDAPVWVSGTLAKADATVRITYSESLTGDASDGDAGDTLTYSKVSGPAWLNVASNGSLSGTPWSADLGLNTFVVRVIDVSGASSNATLNITVAPINNSGEWINPVGGSWFVGGNWSGGTIAGGMGQTADFSTLDITSSPTVTLDDIFSLGTLKFGDTTASHDWILASGSGGPLTLADTTDTPVIQVNNQTTTINAALSGTQGFLKTGAGTLALSGSNTYTGVTKVNAGAVTLSGDQSAANGGWTISPGATVTFHAGSTVAVASGNSVTLTNNSTEHSLTAAGSVTNAGSLLIRSGSTVTLNAGANWSQTGAMALQPLSSSGRAVLNVNAGSVFTYAGTSAISLSGSTASNSGSATLNLTGGTLVTNSSFNNAGSTTGTGSANLEVSSGGILKLTSDIPILATTVGRPFNVQFGTGGGIVDTNGFSTTITQGITGSGGLTKRGGGVLTLSGSNSFTGATTLDGGKLDLTGSLGSTAVEVKSSATLALGGNAGSSVTVRANGHLTIALAANAGSQVSRSIGGQLAFDSGSILDLAAVTTPQSGDYILATAQSISGTPGTVIAPPGVTASVVVVGSTLHVNISVVSPPVAADDDGDGLQNGVEYVFGTNPEATNATAIQTQRVGENLVFTFPRSDASETMGLQVTFEAGDDLQSWPQVFLIGATTGPGVTISENGDAPDTVTVAIPTNGSNRKFARLKVTTANP